MTTSTRHAVWRRRAAAVLVMGAALGLTGPPAAAAADPRFRYYESAVNLPPDAPGTGGYAGAVVFRRVEGGLTSVTLFLSRSAEVVCPDGGGDTASTTLRTADDASEPGPVVLDVDRLLRTARGDAVVDVVLEESPGCGEPSTERVLPAQVVVLRTTGTSDRFRSGIASSIASPEGSVRSSTEDLSRDGVGSVSVGSLLEDAPGAAFLKYAVERTVVSGVPPEVPSNVAPAGGVGATGAHSASGEPAGGLGVVFEDMGVTATRASRARPGEAPGGATVSAFAEVHTRVPCPGGGTGVDVVVLEGSGPAALAVDPRLASATASGTVPLTRTAIDGCAADPEPVTSVVAVPVALVLTASGPPVRVRDVRFHETRGRGDQRTETSYVARDAVGTVTVGSRSAATGLAAISEARG